MRLVDGDHVMIVVTFMPERKGLDPAPVVDHLAEEVQRDLLPKLTESAHP